MVDVPNSEPVEPNSAPEAQEIDPTIKAALEATKEIKAKLPGDLKDKIAEKTADNSWARVLAILLSDPAERQKLIESAGSIEANNSAEQGQKDMVATLKAVAKDVYNQDISVDIERAAYIFEHGLETPIHDSTHEAALNGAYDAWKADRENDIDATVDGN